MHSFIPLGHLHNTIILLQLHTMTRILQGFSFLCKLRLLFLRPHWDYTFKYERKNDSDCTDLKRINLPEVSTKSSALLKGLCKHLIFADVIITNRPASKFHGFFEMISSNLWNRIFIFHFLYCYSSSC